MPREAGGSHLGGEDGLQRADEQRRGQFFGIQFKLQCRLGDALEEHQATMEIADLVRDLPGHLQEGRPTSLLPLGFGTLGRFALLWSF